jgi:hypothetical protein
MRSLVVLLQSARCKIQWSLLLRKYHIIIFAEKSKELNAALAANCSSSSCRWGRIASTPLRKQRMAMIRRTEALDEHASHLIPGDIINRINIDDTANCHVKQFY